MKICFVTPHSPLQSITLVTGVGNFIRNMCLYLESKGLKTTVITSSDGFEFPDDDFLETVTVIRINTEKIIRFKDIFIAFIAAYNLIIHRNDYELIHVVKPTALTAFSAVIGKLLGKHIVLGIRGLRPPSTRVIRRVFDKIMWRITQIFSDIVIFVSEDTKKFHSDVKGIVIPNGINVEKFYPSDTLRRLTRNELGLSDELTMVYVGRVTYNKGIHELLEAFSEVKRTNKKNMKLLIVGPILDDEKHTFFNKCKTLDIENHVVFTGSQLDTHKYYCASDIFIFPSWGYEGMSRALLEAMACGLPPIANVVTGVSEVIEDGINGLLVEPRNVADLVRKINWCISHSEESKKLGLAARKTVREKFSLDLMVERYMHVYNRLVK
jgi:glycosyltransferase involved in cell wall biosynthesis